MKKQQWIMPKGFTNVGSILTTFHLRQQTLLGSESRGIKDLVKGVKQKSDEEQLEEVGVFILGKEAQGKPYHPLQYLKGGWRQLGSVSSSE